MKCPACGQERKRTRSLKANAYYWAVVVRCIADYTGFTPDETHDALKAMFLPKRLAFTDGNGEVIDELVIGGSTREMSTQDFEDYTHEVIRFAGEKLGLHIPGPDEVAA
jgi:hypothetical protein